VIQTHTCSSKVKLLKSNESTIYGENLFVQLVSVKSVSLEIFEPANYAFKQGKFTDMTQLVKDIKRVLISKLHSEKSTGKPLLNRWSSPEQ